jgi:hypothetical protein
VAAEGAAPEPLAGTGSRTSFVVHFHREAR